VSGGVENSFYERIEPVADFSQVVDRRAYHDVPDDWWIGLTDVVKSSEAIAAGRYKAVNVAGAAAIGAVLNALNHKQIPFAFCGDGAQFAVPDADAAVAREALRRTARWVRDSLDLELRVGLIQMRDIRAAGRNVTVARYSASRSVDYAMFSGGGLRWAEAELKAGRLALEVPESAPEPDLSGLSCQWGPLRSRNGDILSIIVRPSGPAADDAFDETVGQLLGILKKAGYFSPVPERGPDIGSPFRSNQLMSRLAGGHGPLHLVRTVALTLVLWLLFRLRLRVGGFDPVHYRRAVGANTDFQKYDDGLYLTIDCSPAIAREVEDLLDAAERRGILTYGLHRQKEALMTCIVPSVANDSHLHFLDGGGGGYASAAARLKDG
jgi:hypothetical protein